MLNISRATVYRYLNEGSLPSVRLSVDGPFRIDPAALEGWLASHATTRGGAA
jgi:excisionase family DNA binding protein